jgi:hypothetical protein
MKKIITIILVGLSFEVYSQTQCPPPISLNTRMCGSTSDSIMLSAFCGVPATYSWSTGATTGSVWVHPAVTTTYSARVTDTCGTGIITTTVDIVQLNVSSSDTITAGDSVILNATGTGVSYKWIPMDSSIVCLNSLCNIVRVTPAVTTIYTVTATDSFGCIGMALTTITVNPVSHSSVALSTGKVSNNPSSTSFSLNLPAKATISVYNETGRLVLSMQEPAGVISFGNELTPGIYFLSINGKAMTKLVKL